MYEAKGRIIVRLVKRRIVGAVVREGWIDCVEALTRYCVPCLDRVSVHPWSARASRLVPSIKGGLIMCWVDKGVKNQREVVIMWGR